MSDPHSPVRFQCEWDSGAPSAPFLYGIRDVRSGDWVVRGLTGPDAGLHAALLSLRYKRATDRPDEAARWLDPPIHVELTVSPSMTEVALLHMWAREDDGWHGYVTYLERHPLDPGRWAPASKLRRLTQDEVDVFAKRPAVQSWGS